MGLTAFSNADLNRALYLVKFSEKIPGRFVENQQDIKTLLFRVMIFIATKIKSVAADDMAGGFKQNIIT